jgi:dimethylglycine dehydrogenase
MIDGEPEIDVWAMDIARFGDYASPDWGTVKSSENYERRFLLTFPNETLPRGRRMRTTALYDRLTARGAVWGDSFGLEAALWYADGPEDAHEEPTFLRSRAHDYVAREVKAVREAVGVTEIANFAKHSIRGPEARKYLDHVMAGRLPRPGRIALSPMLTPKGKLYGDLTVACLADDDFMIFGSGAAQEMHRRWLESNLDGYDLRYANASRRYHGLGLSGPRARDLLARITRDDVSNEGLGFRDVRRTFVGMVPAVLARLSFSGELGYEIYVEPEYQLKLYESILEAGEDLGLAHYGLRALMSLRLEKNWGAWTLDFRPDFTAAQSGLDAFIDWDKDFIGKQSALTERDAAPTIKLVTMTIDTDDIDVSNDEAILKDGECVGYVTSGGYAHHVGKSMALGYVPAELAVDGAALEVEINGEMYAAKVVGAPLYDPAGERMRG